MNILLNNKIILLVSTIVLILSFIITPFLAFADFNQQINYQGKLTDSSGVAVADGTYNMNFWLLASSTAATSTAVWSEVRTTGDRVQVTNGLFSVMLGEVSSLSSVDFNQTLYLGVEIGGTTVTPTWDGEMSPRKILGAVPAAFEAKNAETLAGIATTSFLRSDTIDAMEATSSSALLTLIQNGAGKLLSIFSGVTEMFTISNTGNVGIATTTPSEKLTVIGNTYLNGGLTLTGALKDSTSATGTLGMILKTTGTSTQWVATSTLGLGNGTFLGLTDTPSSYTANRLMFTNSGATALTDSANLVFDGTNLGIGTTTPNNLIQVYDLIDFNNTDFNSKLGYQAGKNIVSGAQYNTFLGYQAGFSSSTASTNVADSNTAVGYRALYSNTTGSYNSAFGENSLRNNTAGNLNSAFGRYSLFNSSTGLYNSAFGEHSLYSNTTGSYNSAFGLGSLNFNATGTFNTAIGYNSLYSNTTGDYNTANGMSSLTGNTTGSYNTALGFDAGRYITGGTIDNSIGSSSVFIGYKTRAANDNEANQIVIGASATGNGSNSVTLGNTSITKTILQGNIGIATTTPSEKLTVIGNTYLNGGLTLTGALKDSTSATGTIGMVLQTTGTSTQWVATSSLGISGVSTFLGLTDTPSSFTANRLMFTNSGATALTDSADLTFDGTNFGVGSQNGIAFGGTRYLYASSTNDSVTFGENAGASFKSSTIYNVAIGFEAGRYASSTDTDRSNLIGYQAGYNNIGAYNNIIGSGAGHENTGWYNNLIGVDAGYNNTGDDNNLIGDEAGYHNTGSDNEMIGHGAGRNLQSTSSVIIGSEAYRGGAGTTAFQAINNTALGYRAGYSAQTGASNNILLGYQAADNITTGANNIVIGYDVDIASTTRSNQLNIGNLIFGTGIDGTGTSLSSGNIGIGTTTPGSRFAIEKLTFTGAGVAGITQNIRSTNVTASAVQYGNFGYLYASNTATTTIAGNMFKIEDNTTFGNTIRGFEVQTDRGINTLGENTALSGFARTFGVRGTTKGDAGGTYEPAGVFAETMGTTQGNAIRGYSSTITSASLLKLFQDSSTFTGTGLQMNFGNSGGSFSSTTASKFIDLQNAGTSMFTVGAYGKLTIGDGTTNNNAGIQVGYGGICVDNDGSCNASTTGRISAVSYHTGNSDLAETYFSNENLKAGEVVYIKGGLSVGRAGEDSKDKVIGVVSTKPGLLLGFDDTSLKAGEKSYPIALKGRVPVRLSTENGEIKAGDELMLSSIPGVVMKASSTGKIVGVALEDFDGGRAYSDTYINQFGDDLVDPVFEPISKDNDPRINDGCYFGGGNASGDEVCIPLVSTTTDGQVVEAEALARREAEERALARLANVSSDNVTLGNGQQVQVGQIVMFVDLRNRTLDEVGTEMILAFTAQASSTDNNEESETVWQRLVNLANNFVDGVLSVFTLKADKVEVKDQLCVDGVCVTGDDLRKLLNNNQTTNTENNSSNDNENNESGTNNDDQEVESSEENTEGEIIEENNPPNDTSETMAEDSPPESVEEVLEEEVTEVEEVIEKTEEPEIEVVAEEETIEENNEVETIESSAESTL